MICSKCNHKLPEDSEFCQYCGSKLGKFIKKSDSDTSKTVYVNVKSKKSVDEIMDEYADAAVEAVMANLRSQPKNENDEDFGLVPGKPIFTLGDKLVAGEKEYLSRLYTIDGDKIQYIRRGSISAEGINGIIDVYDTFLPSGQPYKTLYINMYGAKASTKAPAGFVLLKAEEKGENKPQKEKSVKKEKAVRKKYCSCCGSLIDNKTKKCTGCGKQYFKGIKFTKFSTTVMVMGLIIVSLFSFCVWQCNNIQKYEEKFSKLENELSFNKSTISVLESGINAAQSTIIRLEEDCSNLPLEKWIRKYSYEYISLENRNSKKYHRYDCKEVNLSFFAIDISDVKEAEKMGYYACPQCH